MHINGSIYIKISVNVVLVLNQSQSKTKCFKVTLKTQQLCININILLWQHVLVLLDQSQACIQKYEAQSVHIMYYGIPNYIQDVHKNIV